MRGLIFLTGLCLLALSGCGQCSQTPNAPSPQTKMEPVAAPPAEVTPPSQDVPAAENSGKLEDPQDTLPAADDLGRDLPAEEEPIPPGDNQ